MKSRSFVFIVLAAALLLAAGTSCQRTLKPPVFVAVPENVYAGDTAHLRLVTYVIGYQSSGYVMDWGDTVETDSGRFPLGETATVSHVWSAPGVKRVRARAFPFADPTQLTDWSETETVAVVAGGSHAPVVDSVPRPPLAVRGETTRFLIYAQYPDGDSIRAIVAWGDSTDTTTGLSPSPATINTSHVFAQVESAEVVVMSVQDKNGATSLPDTVRIQVVSGDVGRPGRRAGSDK